MIFKRLVVASIAFVGGALMVAVVEPLPCTSDQYASFKQTTIAAPVNKCMSASEVKLGMPPTSDLTETQRDQICAERVCKDMIAAIDDMDIPRCDLLYNGKNTTLQMSLDHFTSICDAPRSVAPDVKKRMAKKGERAASMAATVLPSSKILVGALVVVAVSIFF